MRKKILIAALLSAPISAFCQDDTSRILLKDIRVTANKWSQPINDVSNRVVPILKKDILFSTPQTAADALSNSGAVFVQKSQLGGGSPMIRGFATNRVLIVFDGVRMNNAIFRGGNLQNVISIDPLALEKAEVIFGPGSLVYGSDAIAGVMDFHALEPVFSQSKKTIVKGSVYSRYASANNEKTGHIDFNIAGKNISSLTSISYSDFKDLKMGKNGGRDSYLRNEYVVRAGKTDSIVKNSDPRLQVNSGYDQLNILQKLKFKISDKVSLGYTFSYGRTGDAPRYDRLIQYRSGKLRFAEWYYGPMTWQLHSLQASSAKATSFWDEAKFVAAYQRFEESRNSRSRNSSKLNVQSEAVDAYSLNLDARKKAGILSLQYGAEIVANKVSSTGADININTIVSKPSISRYPDGSKWFTTGIYAHGALWEEKSFSLQGGLRYSFNHLSSTFDSSFIKFPFSKVELNEGAVTGSIGFINKWTNNFQINATISTGYRMPNVDDVGKLFETSPGFVTVPNPDLKAEYAYNFEIGLIKAETKKYQISAHLFYTYLDNAIVRRNFSIGGQDSILFEGNRSKVQALVNAAKATVHGAELSTQVNVCNGLLLRGDLTYTKGKETDEAQNTQVPLRHAAPLFGSVSLEKQFQKLRIKYSWVFNGQIRNEDLAPSEQDKAYIYASNKNGDPFAPGWYTFNLNASYNFSKNISATAAWKNFTNRQYRPYSSGIVAAGSDVIIGLRVAM